MKTRLISLIVVFVAIGSTSSFGQDIVLPEELKSNTKVYDVKGRYGFTFKKVITFGEYKTSKIKKGWIKSSNTSFFVNFRKAEQKFSFTQYSPSKLEAEVSCVGELQEKDVDVVKDFFALDLSYKNCFSGNITIAGDTVNWEFLINDPDDNPGEGVLMGSVKKANKVTIEIYPIVKLEGKKIPKLFQQLFGYEFRYNNNPIGALSIYNKGDVYFSKDASDEHKLIMACLSTALLVKTDLEEETD